jgi:hypothetical protein
MTDADRPQVVGSSLTEQEAAVLANHLKSLGIQAHIWGANSSLAWPEVPHGVQVVVRQVDITRAKAAVAQLRGKKLQD